MQWWCAAQGVPWEWSWRPYPGVWAFLGLLALAYVGLRRRAAGDRAGRRRAAFVAGWVLLWIALDWPVGALGAGYLASVHMVQFLLIALAAPPLLLYALPPSGLRRLPEQGPLERALRTATHPALTILLFHTIVVATHWPSAVDRLMASQAGSFLLDLAWLVGGLLFWWPVVCPVPKRRFPYPAKIGYLILATVLGTAPFLFLTLAELPFYATYELAPPVAGISARQDQRIAGILMKLGGGAVLWTAITVLFFRWWAFSEAGADTP